MRKLPVLVLLLLGATPPQEPASLIEQLRGDDIGQRERAFLELERLGPSAERDLKKAAETSDATLAFHARRLLKIIELERLFSPALKKAVPGISRRIASDEKTQWTQTYLEVFDAEPQGRDLDPFPGLKRQDLEPLAVPALVHAAGSELKRRVFKIGARLNHRSLIPELAKVLKDPDSNVAEEALRALVDLEGRAAIPIVLAEVPEARLGSFLNSMWSLDPFEFESRLAAGLAKPASSTIQATVNYLRYLESRELTARAPDLLEHSEAWVREVAMGDIQDRGEKRLGHLVLRALFDSSASVRTKAIQTVVRLDLAIPPDMLTRLAKDKSESLRALAMERAARSKAETKYELLREGLTDSDPDVRTAALAALEESGRPEHAGWARPLVDDGYVRVRHRALRTLARLEGDRTAPMLKEILASEQATPDDRILALDLVSETGSSPATEILAGLIEKAPPNLAQKAANALVARSPELLTAGLIEKLTSDHSNWGTLIVDILARSRSDAAGAALLGMLEGGYDCRVAAGRALYDFGPARMTPVLREKLKSEDEQVRRMAAQILGNWRAVEAGDDLASLLEDEERDVCRAALFALDRMGPKEHLSKIRGLLSHEKSPIRVMAAEVLSRHGDKEAVPVLRQWLKEPGTMAEAAAALFDLGDREWGPALADALYSNPPGDQFELRRLATILRPPEALSKLTRGLEHRDSSDRDSAAEAVGDWGDASVAPRLLPLLSEPDTSGAAVRAIVALDARAVTPDLIKLLSAPGPTARMAAAKALAGLEARDAASRIRPLLNDRDGGVRAAAAEAAGRLEDRDSASELVFRLHDPARAVRAAAARSLAQVKAVDAFDPLIACLDDPSGIVREAARDSLLSLRPAGFRTEILKRFRDPLEKDREIYLSMLSECGAKEAALDLIGLLADSSLAYAACRELGELGATEAAPAIRKLKGFGIVAAESLAKLGDRSALESLLADPDPEARFEAARALCAEGDRRGIPALLDRLEAIDRSQFPFEYSDS